MKLKTVEVNGKTYAEVSEGKPVFIEDDGKETAFDAPGTKATISRLNAEAKTHREAKEAAEGALKKFEGITDPAAAVKAIETLKNIDAKKLVDAGQVETIKAEVSKGYDEKIANMAKTHAEELAKERTEKEGVTRQFHTATISSGFANSKFVADKFIVPASMLQDTFGKHFKVEDGKVIAYDNDGHKLLSRARPAENATFDEALEMLVDKYPYKDHILKGKGGGSGAKNGAGGGGKTMSRAQYEADPIAGAAKLSEGYTLAD